MRNFKISIVHIEALGKVKQINASILIVFMKCQGADIILKIKDYLEISDIVLFGYMKKKASSFSLFDSQSLKSTKCSSQLFNKARGFELVL